MSDAAGLVQSDELQKEFEFAEGHQSCQDAAATDAAGLCPPPTRIIRSYDRQGEVVTRPPPYTENTGGVALRAQQQVEQEYRRQIGQAPYQAPYPRQFQQLPDTTVVRVPANCQVVQVAPNYWQTRACICGTIVAVKAVVVIIIVIFLTASH